MLCSISTRCDCAGEETEDATFEAPKIYEPIPSLEGLAERLTSYQEQYNESIRGAKMDLVFFKVLLILGFFLEVFFYSIFKKMQNTLISFILISLFLRKVSHYNLVTFIY